MLSGVGATIEGVGNRQAKRARRQRRIEKRARSSDMRPTIRPAMSLPDMSDLPPGMQRVVEAMYATTQLTITAKSIGLDPLTAEQRLALLSGIDSVEVLIALGEMQAALDAAMRNNSPTLPHEAMRVLDSQWFEPVRVQLVDGRRLATPQAMVRLMREVIEAGEGPRQGIPDDDALLSLLLSVNDEHDSTTDWTSRFSTLQASQIDAEMRAMPEDDLKALAHQAAVDEAASVLFNAPQLPEYMKCLTHEFWYHPWAEKVGDEFGLTPADTFREATGIRMDEFLLAGDLITSVLRTGRAHYDLGALRDHGVSDQVVEYIRRNMVRDLDGFRTMSRRDRERGDVRAQRYTFTRFPFLDLGGDKILALRAQWGMDRFFGNAPEFDVQQGFHEQGRPDCAKRFQDAVKHQFEQIIGRIIARIATLTPAFDTVLDEGEMQSAWTEKKGQPPKACDWVLPTRGFAWLLDATHRPLRASLAEGIGDGEDYASNIAAFWTDKKAIQFESVIDHLTRLGWKGKQFDDVKFAPFVVVPDVGLPSTPLAMMLVSLSAQRLMEKYEGRVLVPAVISISDLMLLEGLAEMCVVKVADLIKAWRQVGLVSLQQFLAMSSFPYLPCPQHMSVASAALDTRIHE